MAKKVYPIAIVGAGIHGTAITAHLLESRVPRASIALIDENACCKAWEETTSNMGMTHMRSPWAHYLSGHGEKLKNLAHVLGMADGELAPTPPLQTFNSYSAIVIYNHHIEELRIPARVTKVEQAKDRTFVLQLNRKSWGRHQKIRARNVVIATGQGIPHIPDIPGVHDPKIVHSQLVNVHSKEWNSGSQRLLIVGGGLTAATLAVRLAEKGHYVRIAMREKMKVYPFDFPPAWFERGLYHTFRYIRGPHDRVQMLNENTYGGSITPEYVKKMKDLYPAIRIWESKTVREFTHTSSGGISPVWDHGSMPLWPYDKVILATGYDPHIYNLDFLEPLFPKIYHINGFPVLANTLEATNGLFFSGALARLGIGAAAPNVYGADLAGRIILAELIRNGTLP